MNKTHDLDSNTLRFEVEVKECIPYIYNNEFWSPVTLSNNKDLSIIKKWLEEE